MKWLLWIIVLIVVIGGGWYLLSDLNGAPQMPATVATSTTPADTYGMSEYNDPSGFSFWYPSSITVTASTTDDTTSFPGGTEIERITVGQAGGTYIAVVRSPQSTITDEPNGHASPIPQTKYFYDATSGQWMITHPEGTDNSGSSATTTASASGTTIGGFVMLPSGARFDTTIIPLSTTEFLVIGDGGGSSFTSELAQTVATSGSTIDPTAEENALQAEANAYNVTQ